MTIVEARFQIVTPMFLGGAGQKAEGIRPPSIKGALRFWWRALNWGPIRTGKQNDIEALQALHEREKSLFGLAVKTMDNRQVGGQGAFLLAVKKANSTPARPDIPRFSGKAYLAGMGLENRDALPEKTEFEISLCLRSDCSQVDQDSIGDALRVFGLVGGLGSRNRRGYGSVARMWKDGDRWRLPTEAELQAEIEWLEGLISTSPLQTAPFSALTRYALLRLHPAQPTADTALEAEGKEMSRYRTSGTDVVKDRNGRVLETARPGHRILERGKPQAAIGQLNFWTDHIRVHAIASARALAAPNNVPPDRAVFGLPHPYRFSSLNGRKVSYDFAASWETTDAKGRRASPLFVHIGAYQENGRFRYRPILLLLPAKFLPKGERLRVSVDGTHVGNVDPPTAYGVIQRFL